MKKILLATSALAMTAGFAAAEVTLSGDARMGIIDDFGGGDAGFTSRARVTFTLSGETDTGLSFGASFRADNAGGAASGTAGSVYVSGAFGKLSMGDVDGAANAAMGHVDGVGLTGLSDLNELIFLGNGGTDVVVFDANFAGTEAFSGDPSVLYEYSTGALSLYASLNQPNYVLPISGYEHDLGYAIAAAYTMDGYKFAIGYERVETSAGATEWTTDQVSIGADATFGSFVLKARYMDGGTSGNNGFDQDHEQMAVSGTYTMDALAVTAFVSDLEASQGGVVIVEREAYGLGASYDLGGGAKVVGGYVKNDTADDSAFDLGLSFSF